MLCLRRYGGVMESKLNTYIEGIGNNEYHADKDFLSSSQLKYAVKDHGNFNYMMAHREDREKTVDSAMDFGSLVHAMLLEPHTVETDFVFMDTDGRNWRTKVDREYKAQFMAGAGDKMVLSYTAKKRAEQCAANAMAHPFFNKLLTAPGIPEASGFYEDDFYKLKLRFRPDRLITDLDGGSAILDVKTTANIKDFERKAKYDFNYDLSAHMYIKGDLAIRKVLDVPFYFGVVESQPPYRVAVYKASDQFLYNGMKKYTSALSNVKIARNMPADNIRFQEVDYQEI